MSGHIWASAVSKADHALAAADECAREIKASLHGETHDVLFVFIHSGFGPHYQGVLDIFQQMLKPQHLLGGTAGGVIGAGLEIEGQPAMSVVAARLPKVQLTSFFVDSEGLPDADEGPAAWEKTLGVSAARKPHFVLIGSPGMRDLENLLQGLDFAYSGSKKVGGLASGIRNPIEPCLFLGDTVRAKGTVGLALSGDIQLDTLVAQGCRPIGKPMAVTGCDRNLVTALDGKKPVEVLAELFEKEDENTRTLMNGALFLGVVMDPFKSGPPVPGDFLIRTVLGIDPKDRSLAVGALLRPGQVVQFHVRDADSARQDLGSIFSHYNGTKGEQMPSGALLFSCLGRGEHMYGEANYDSSSFAKRIGAMPLGGFFCSGEIGQVGGATYIHGFTSSFGLFSPKEIKN